MKKLVALVLLASPVSFGSPTLYANDLADPADRKVPFRLEEHLIVAEGSVMGKQKIRFLIDTGSTSTIVDKDLVESLGLTTAGPPIPFVLLDKVIYASQAWISNIRLGPLLESRACLVADLPAGFDVLIGLDLLRLQNFTIDYEARSLAFGGRPLLESRTPFDPDSLLVIVSMRLDQKRIRLAVDTGAATITIIRCPRLRSWVQDLPTSGEMTKGLLGGSKSVMRQVALDNTQLGEDEWGSVSALVVEGAPENSQLKIEGYLGLHNLALKQIHFDFERNLVSWKR